MNISIDNLKQISQLSRLPISNLRQKNKESDRAYIGKELTKYQLIYQIVFKQDAPNV